MKEYKKYITEYSIKNQVRYKGNLGKKQFIYVMTISLSAFNCSIDFSEVCRQKRTKLL